MRLRRSGCPALLASPSFRRRVTARRSSRGQRAMTVPARIASLSWLLCHHRGTLEPCDVHETVEHLLACGTEIQQAGDLVDAKATELVRHCAAYVTCPHQRCVREVPIKGNVQQFPQTARPDPLRTDTLS